jgi:hypothetical protein
MEDGRGRKLTQGEMAEVLAQVKQNQLHGNQARKNELMNIASFADNLYPPNNEAEYHVWAKGILDSVKHGSQNRLHPLLSYIWLPYEQPNKTWARSWLPEVVPDSTPGWKLTLMYCLGASHNDIATRIVTLGVEEQGYKKQVITVASKIRKRVDDWRLEHGGLLFSTATKQAIPKVTEAILTGVYREKNGPSKANKRYRAALTQLQLHFNCSWQIDSKNGIMVQPAISSRHTEALDRQNYVRLFKPRALPEQIGVCLDSLNISRPRTTDLRIQHPKLLQAHLLQLDQDKEAYMVGAHKPAIPKANRALSHVLGVEHHRAGNRGGPEPPGIRGMFDQSRQQPLSIYMPRILSKPAHPNPNSAYWQVT